MKIPTTGFRNYQNIAVLVIIVVFAGAGVTVLRRSHAATPAISTQPELGGRSSTTDPSSAITDTTASGGRAIKFGPSIAPNTPISMQVYTGGTSTALIWAPREGRIPAVSYKVFRDGRQIGTSSPRTNAKAYVKGNRYNDLTVARGTRYSYQVQAVAANGQVSPLSAAYVVITPTATTPVPTITLDATAAPDLANWMNTVVIPDLKVWYPKISDRVAYPNYTPRTSISLFLDPNPEAVGYAYSADGRIGAGIKWLREHPDDVGLFIHEAAHVIHNGKNAPGWVSEGFADWSREFLYQDRFVRLDSTRDYTIGYTQGSSFIEWMRRTYSGTIIREMIVSTHNGTYTSNFIPSKTGGLSIDQLWTKMTKGLLKSTSLSNICMEAKTGQYAYGNPITASICSSSNTSERWSFVGQRADKVTFQTQNGYCLDVGYPGLDDDIRVWTWVCDGNKDQLWQFNSNGTISNPSINKCLTLTSAGGSVTGSQLVIQTCDSTNPNQKLAFQ